MPYITANWVLIYYLYTNLYKGPWITFVNIDSTCPTHKTPRKGHGFGAQLMTAPQLVRLGDPREMLREKNAGQCIKPNQTHSLTPWNMPKRLGIKWVDNLCMFLIKRNRYFVVKLHGIHWFSSVLAGPFFSRSSGKRPQGQYLRSIVWLSTKDH